MVHGHASHVGLFGPIVQCEVLARDGLHLCRQRLTQKLKEVAELRLLPFSHRDTLEGGGKRMIGMIVHVFLIPPNHLLEARYALGPLALCLPKVGAGNASHVFSPVQYELCPRKETADKSDSAIENLAQLPRPADPRRVDLLEAENPCAWLGIVHGEQ